MIVKKIYVWVVETQFQYFDIHHSYLQLQHFF